MLVDAPFAPILREWQWSSPSGTTALFWLLALVAAGILALRRCRSRVTFYELAVLVLTFAGAVQAVRGVIWFALAAAAILPVALDGLLTKEDVEAPKVNRIISLAALAGLAVAALVFVARPASWFVSEWPEARVAAVREATRDPNVRVWATDGTADWLLWRIPDLRGRLAYDVRFELYDQPTLDRIVRYGRRRGRLAEHRWTATAVVVVDYRPLPASPRRRAGSPRRVPRRWDRGRRPTIELNRTKRWRICARRRESRPGLAVRPDKGRDAHANMGWCRGNRRSRPAACCAPTSARMLRSD